MNLKDTIEKNDSAEGKIFDIFIQILILLSLIAFSIETIPDLSDNARKTLNYFEIFSVLIFTIEYCLRILVSDRKLKFIFSFYGLIDFFAILPFFLPIVGVDLRSIRILRLFRLFRAFKLFRYSSAIHRFHYALLMIKEELILFSILAVMLLYFSAVGIFYFENAAQPEAFSSIFQSMWWAVATLTTVGYGDIYPVTTGGKLFTFLVLMVGLGIVAVPTGLVASALSSAREMENSQNDKNSER